MEYAVCKHYQLLRLCLTLLQLLAYALANMAGIGGYNSWRWIFIIEGLATFIIAVASKFLIVDWPETSRFLTLAERQLLLRRLSEDVADARMDHFDRKARRRTFGDWKIYVGYLICSLVLMWIWYVLVHADHCAI